MSTSALHLPVSCLECPHGPTLLFIVCDVIVLVGVKVTPIGSARSTVRKYGSVGVNVSDGESASLGISFEVSEAQAKSSVSLSLPAASGSSFRTLSYLSSTMSVGALPCSLP